MVCRPTPVTASSVRSWWERRRRMRDTCSGVPGSVKASATSSGWVDGQPTRVAAVRRPELVRSASVRMDSSLLNDATPLVMRRAAQSRPIVSSTQASRGSAMTKALS
ncbi:hypothetical protein SANTM175S_07825 [Streptomyces antimycoticus]